MLRVVNGKSFCGIVVYFMLSLNFATASTHRRFPCWHTCRARL